MNILELCKGKRVCHISHNDLDGFGGTVLGLYYIAPITSSYQTHNSDDYDVLDFDLDKAVKLNDVFIFTDFSPTKRAVEIIQQTNKEYYIYDHHISRADELKNISGERFLYDNTKCGTQIFFDELTKGKRVKKVIFQFVELVNTYDLYNMQSALWRDAKGLSNILWGLTSWFSNETSTAKSRRFIDAMMYKFETQKSFFFDSYEQEMMLKAEKKEKENYEMAKKNLSIRKDGAGNLYGYFECSSKVSIVCNWILKDNENFKYVISRSTFNDKKGIEPKVSIRSVDDRAFDCSVVASLHGGGGHKCAAGVEFESMEFFNKLRRGEVHLI